MNAHTYIFEKDTYCDVDIPNEFLTLTCRRLSDGSALCVAWERWSSDSPAKPSDVSRRKAEMIAAQSFETTKAA